VATARSAHGEPDGNGEPNGDGESDQLNSGPKHQGNYHQNPIDQTRAWISSNWSIVCVLTNRKLLANRVAWSHPIDKSDKLVNGVQQRAVFSGALGQIAVFRNQLQTKLVPALHTQHGCADMQRLIALVPHSTFRKEITVLSQHLFVVEDKNLEIPRPRRQEVLKAALFAKIVQPKQIKIRLRRIQDINSPLCPACNNFQSPAMAGALVAFPPSR
jgi:hypothetical protein